MKKKLIGFALIIAAFVSITSGCFVRNGRGHNYTHHDQDHHDRDH